MNKITLFTLVFVAAALGTSVALLPSFDQEAKVDAPPGQFKKVVDCAAYYELASDTINGMNVPQMKPVAARLEQFGIKARGLAEGMASADVVQQAIADARQQHVASLPNPNSLGPLMGKYKESCQALVLDTPPATS